MSHFYRSFTLIILISLLFVSCSDDDGFDGKVEAQLWDIVTYEGPKTDGSGSTFTFRQVNDTPLITLTSDKSLGDTETGNRLMIRYIPLSGIAYQSGQINLISASMINQSAVKTEWKEEYNEWDRDKVFLYSIWRTGSFINFHLRLTYSAEPRIFTLAPDTLTLGTVMPEFYLVHVMSTPTDNHDRAYFASFDFSEFWNTPAVKGVKIHVANDNLDKDIFTFDKTI
ncbi:MAG: hypothetical protein NC411_01485 [Bacteroides sp.]|nr:hypothetical protein [Bacteroides sp.]